MTDCTRENFHKTVIINRAVSGSGKTTLSRCVTEALKAHGLSVSVHSTDEFFMKDGRYVFEIEKLNGYHARNLANFEAALERGDDVVICDNMNLLPWQSQPYTNAARKYKYRILFLNFLPRELEKHLAAQVVTAEKPDAHGLSKELLMRFIQNFNDYNDLLDKNTVRDINRHKRFVWNFAENKPMDTGELALYFDSDYVITIRPEQYQEVKKTLADSVLKLVTESDEELKTRDPQKHYLLTWYGITDIRAALGLEPSDGPVLGHCARENLQMQLFWGIQILINQVKHSQVLCARSGNGFMRCLWTNAWLIHGLKDRCLWMQFAIRFAHMSSFKTIWQLLNSQFAFSLKIRLYPT